MKNATLLFLLAPKCHQTKNFIITYLHITKSVTKAKSSQPTSTLPHSLNFSPYSFTSLHLSSKVTSGVQRNKALA